MSLESVPVIDINRLTDPETEAAIDLACRDWGFFQITNHGVDTRLIGDLQRSMRAFFALPKAQKDQVLRTRDNPWGYYDNELTKNVRDWKEVFDYGPGDGNKLVPQFPKELPDFKEAIIAYTGACETLAFRLLAVISSNLGMAGDFLGASFGTAHTSFLRLNHYPVCPEPARPDGLASPESGHLGISHHTDAGALTLLLQDDVPGLEICLDGDWIPVDPVPGTLVVNIGDIAQVWSNDRYIAPLHRVVASRDRDRYSLPYFFNPSYSCTYAPVPELLTDRERAHYSPIHWGHFRKERQHGDYGDYGKEIQIADFRIVP